MPVWNDPRINKRKKLPSVITSDTFEYTADELEFMSAMDRYKRDHHRPFPTCSEVLAVAVSLGYRKVECPPEE